MAIKINEPSHEEVIEVRLSREKTPIAFKKSWMNSWKRERSTMKRKR